MAHGNNLKHQRAHPFSFFNVMGFVSPAIARQKPVPEYVKTSNVFDYSSRTACSTGVAEHIMEHNKAPAIVPACTIPHARMANKLDSNINI